MFNRHFFAAAIETYCEKHKLSLRDAARESGVSASTLSRLMSGEKTPDIETFGRVCDWMHVEPSSFFPGEGAPASLQLAPLPMVCAILRSDQQLGAVAREKLADLVKAAYQCLARESDA